MKKHTMKQTLSAILVCLMLLSAFPLTAIAEVSSYEDGALLLRMDALDSKNVTFNPYGVTVKVMPNAADGKRDPADSSRILVGKNEEAGRPRGGIGLKTDLPLDGSTAYTIEYYAKLNDRANGLGMYMGFCLQTELLYPFYGVDMYAYSSGTLVGTHNKWWMNGYYKEGSTTDYGGRTLPSNIWETAADEDGFVRFVLTFDGQYMGLSIGGTDIGVRYDLDRPRGSDFMKVDSWAVKTLNLEAGFAYFTQGTVTDPAIGDCVVELKDISVYSGVVDPSQVAEPQIVNFKNAKGEVIKSYVIPSSGELTLDSFPTIASANQVIWFNEETGALAKAPMTFTESCTIIANEMTLNKTRTLGVQYSEVSGGKQNVRFIGGTYNLEGAGIGFDVIARYKDASGNVVEALYRQSGNTVYDSINATENGTMKNVTAQEIGGVYLFAMVLEDVPTNIGQIDFVVKSFKQVGKSKLRMYGDEVTFSFKDGVIDKSLAPLA